MMEPLASQKFISLIVGNVSSGDITVLSNIELSINFSRQDLDAPIVGVGGVGSGCSDYSWRW